MRLIQHLNELTYKPTTDGIVSDVTTFLMKQCSSIINVYKKTNNVLYRGITYGKFGEPILLVSKKMHREERFPKDMDPSAHEWLNKYFNDNVGWPVRNGISTTPSFQQAEDYGTAFIFFPQNRWKYAYLPDIDDLYSKQPYFPGKDADFDQFMDDIASGIEPPEPPGERWKWREIIEDWTNFFDNLESVRFGADHSGLSHAIHTAEGEIMFNSPNYWLLNRFHTKSEEVLEKIGLEYGRF
jgi:hypothetical protein